MCVFHSNAFSVSNCKECDFKLQYFNIVSFLERRCKVHNLAELIVSLNSASNKSIYKWFSWKVQATQETQTAFLNNRNHLVVVSIKKNSTGPLSSFFSYHFNFLSRWLELLSLSYCSSLNTTCPKGETSMVNLNVLIRWKGKGKAPQKEGKVLCRCGPAGPTLLPSLQVPGRCLELG